MPTVLAAEPPPGRTAATLGLAAQPAQTQPAGSGGAGATAPPCPEMQTLPESCRECLRACAAAPDHERKSFSRRPSPDLPTPMFFDIMRPLGKLQLSTEVNFEALFTTQDLPDRRLGEAEIVLLDWTAAEFAATFEHEKLVEYVFGIQQTLGVGKEENWAHGIFFHFPIVFPQLDNIIGARPLYVIQWRPAKEHWFAYFQAIGAERLAFVEDGEPEGLWRPFFAAAPFFHLTKNLLFAVEVNARAYDDEHGFFLALPQLLWKPGQHLELTLGAGWMREQTVNDYPVIFRIFIYWDSPRVPCTAAGNPLGCDHGWLGGFGWLAEEA